MEDKSLGNLNICLMGLTAEQEWGSGDIIRKWNNVIDCTW